MSDFTPRELVSSDFTTNKRALVDAIEGRSFLAPEAEIKANEELSEDYQTELGQTYYQLAKAYYDKADIIEAERFFNRALSLAILPRDSFTCYKALGFLIRIASERLDHQRATEYMNRMEKIIDQQAQSLGSLNAEYFYNLGLLKNYYGDFRDARENFLLALKKSKEENEPELLAKCFLALANNFFQEKDYNCALNYLDQLDQLLKIIDKSYLNGNMLLLYGKIYGELNQFQKALQYLEMANYRLQMKKCWNLFGHIMLVKGKIFKNMGEFDKGLFVYQLALEHVDQKTFKGLTQQIMDEIRDVQDSSIDIYLDRTNRKVMEKTLGVIDFKHRFVLLEILFLLAKNAGTYYNKDQLAKSIWKDEYNPLIHDKLIYTSVSRLRKLIEPKNEKGQKRKYIIRGKDGYTFNPRVKIRFHLESKGRTGPAIANIDLGSPV